MVASDTVVGLVGAGILLVALVGVFVYESQQGQGTDKELKDAMYDADPAGSTYSFSPASGQTVPTTNTCVPQTQCTPPRATITVKVCGLPMPGNLKYVAFVEGGSAQATRIGSLTPSGNCFGRAQETVNGNFGSDATVSISVEETDAPAAASWKIVSFKTSGGSLGGVQPARFVTSGGEHKLTLTGAGTQTTANAQLKQVVNKTGYSYRGWMVKDDTSGISYEFVGNFTADAGSTGAKQDGSIRGNVPGAVGGYARFIVTLEKGFDAKRPTGPPVILSTINGGASPTVAK